ncbi:MAG: carboxypeptidase-like regulatory domain-containing protein [Planctomycetia bacterium]
MVAPVFVLTVGCGEWHGRVPVEGVITLDGKPVAGASVTFIPRGKGRPGLGETDADGRFLMREAGMKPGLPPGDYAVVALLAVWSTGRPAQFPLGSPEEGKTGVTVEVMTAVPTIERYIVPKRYSSPDSSGLSASIAGPTRDLVFDLTTNDAP